MFRRKEREGTGRPAVPAPPPPPLAPPPPARDATIGNPRVGPAHIAAGNNDHRGVLAIIAEATTWNERSFIIDDLVGVERFRPTFQQWAAADPNDAVTAVLHGASLIRNGWEARGSGWASTVGEDDWMAFVRLIREADEQLERAVRLDPASPLPWWNLVTTARALSLSKHELRWRHDEMVRRDPGLHYGHDQMLQGLCSKWGGDDAEMLEFARTTAERAGDGSPLHALIVGAHLELSQSHEGGDHAYFRQPDLAAEIRTAAQRSVSNTGFVDGPDDVTPVLARNWFALGLALCGDQAEAQRQLAAIGARITEVPWSMWEGEPRDIVAAFSVSS